MKINSFGLSLLALSLGSSSFIKVHAQGITRPPAVYEQDRAWENPPSEFKEFERQGYHDGVEGARKDYNEHRKPDVNNRDEYRHPKVERSAQQDYREGFRQGYESAASHLMNDHDHDHNH